MHMGLPHTKVGFKKLIHVATITEFRASKKPLVDPN